METNCHLHYKCRWGSFVCFVFSRMFCRQNPILHYIFRKKLHDISSNETLILTNDCVWEAITCIPIFLMETNHYLHRYHWGSFVCFVFLHMFCQNPLLPFVFRKSIIKSVLMKLSYVMVVFWKRKRAYLFPLW